MSMSSNKLIWWNIFHRCAFVGLLRQCQ